MRFLRGLAALIGLIIGLAGVPFALLILGGNPLPEQLGWTELVNALFRPDDGTLLIGLITIIGWLAWLIFTVSVMVEIVGQISGYRITIQLPGMATPQRFAAGLVVAVVTMIGLPAQAESVPDHSVVAVAEKPTQDDFDHGVAAPAPPPVGGPQSARDREPGRKSGAVEAQAGVVRHQVKKGDDLWSLAERYYGDGREWRKIATANPEQLSGGPDVLEPGWQLIIPDVDQPTDPKEKTAGDPPTVRVKKGDSLWAIAERVYGDPHRWSEIYRANRFQIGDPDEIEIGMQLILPSEQPTDAAERDAGGPKSEQRDNEGSKSEQHDTGGPKAEQPKGGEPESSDDEAPKRSESTDRRAPESQPVPRLSPEPDPEYGGAPVEQPGAESDDGPGAAPDKDGESAPDSDSTTESGSANESGSSTESGSNTESGSAADPGSAADSGSAAAAAEEESPEVAAALAGLAGTGGLLAAAVIGGLTVRRQAQLQRRPLGRQLRPTTAAARAVEAALGRRQRPMGLRNLDHALRAISAHCHATATPLPPLRLAAVGDDELELIMERPTGGAPAGFTVRGSSWVVSADDVGYLRTIPGFGEATRPYPALVGLGSDTSGRPILADLEGIGILAVDADDPELAPALFAAMATELSFSPWADEMILTLVGDRPELADPLARHNVTQTDDLDGLLDQLERRAEIQRQEQAARPVALLRSDPDLADPWAPEIVLVDRAPSTRQLARMGDIVAADTAGQTRPSVTMAIVVPGAGVQSDWVLRMSTAEDPSAGSGAHAELLPAGLHLEPQLLRPAAAEAVVELVAATVTEDTVPAPWWFHGAGVGASRRRDARSGPRSGPELVDGSGRLTRAMSDEESPPGADPPTNVAYLGERLDFGGKRGGWGEAALEHERTRTTMQGQGDQGPGQVHHPTLRLLGAIGLDGATGPAPARADKQCLEYCGWLLEHPGSTARAMAAALAVAEGTRRSNMSRLRSWLGSTPEGDQYLPDAYSGRIALHPVVSSDWHRLQILTLGGVNRSGDDALFAGLELVRGAPLADAAPGQWHWAEELRTDMISAVRDIGVELCQRALDRNDLDLARWSAARALAAAPGDEMLLVARIRTEHQAGNHSETERLALQLAGHARTLGVDLDQETVRVLQQVMEGQVRVRLA